MQGKVCLVTGGTTGIGLGVALALAQAGGNVVITGRNKERGAQTVQEIERQGHSAMYLQQDVTVNEDWRRVIDHVELHYGQLHVLVNNAGVYLNKPFLESSLDEFDRLIAVNLRSVVLGIKAAMPLMSRTAMGGAPASVVNVSSDAGIMCYTRQSFYNVSKGAVDVLTKTLGRELLEAGLNVRVNAVNPYFTTSNMTDVLFGQMLEQTGMKAEDLKEAIKAPIGRVANPEDIGNLVVFLASDKSSFISGTTNLIDGAASIGGGGV